MFEEVASKQNEDQVLALFQRDLELAHGESCIVLEEAQEGERDHQHWYRVKYQHHDDRGSIIIVRENVEVFSSMTKGEIVGWCCH